MLSPLFITNGTVDALFDVRPFIMATPVASLGSTPVHSHTRDELDALTERIVSNGDVWRDITIDGVRYLGHGISRVGFRLACGQCVLKVEYNGRAGQSAREVRVWQSAPSWIRPYLCPILDSGDSWTLMPLVDRTGDLTYAVSACAAGTRGTIDDLHRGNVGFLNGEPVIIDYAGGLGDSPDFDDEMPTECEDCCQDAMDDSVHCFDCRMTYCELHEDHCERQHIACSGATDAWCGNVRDDDGDCLACDYCPDCRRWGRKWAANPCDGLGHGALVGLAP